VGKMTETISQEELRVLFGDEIPYEVVSFFFSNGNGAITVGEYRAWVRGFSAGMKRDPSRTGRKIQ